MGIAIGGNQLVNNEMMKLTGRATANRPRLVFHGTASPVSRATRFA